VFPLPPINEQRKIVKKVSELMLLCDELDTAEQDLDTLEERFAEYLPKSILQAAVQGKLVPQNPKVEPASELLKRIRQEKARLIRDGKIKKEKPLPSISEDEIPYELPEGWGWCRLGEIIELVSGRDLEPNQYNDNFNGIPYITGASAIENDTVLINRWTDKPVVVSHINDILLSCKGTVGKIVLNTVGGCHIARQIMAIRVFSDNMKHEYIKLFLHNYVVQLNLKAKSIIPGISRDNVLFALCPVPPLAEQQRIVDKIDELMSVCDELKNVQQAISLDDTYNAIPFPQRAPENADNLKLAMAARGNATDGLSEQASRDAAELFEGEWDD
jgi:type I restriction enzyme S subunit